jgi:hypothetical protein
MLTGCPTFNFLIDELIQDAKFDKLCRFLKQYVIEKKFIVVALSKYVENNDVNNSDFDDNMLTLPNYGYTVLDVKSKHDNWFIYLRKVWYDPKKEEKCKQYLDELTAKFPSLKSEINEGILILSLLC